MPGPALDRRPAQHLGERLRGRPPVGGGGHAARGYSAVRSIWSIVRSRSATCGRAVGDVVAVAGRCRGTRSGLRLGSESRSEGDVARARLGFGDAGGQGAAHLPASGRLRTLVGAADCSGGDHVQRLAGWASAMMCPPDVVCLAGGTLPSCELTSLRGVFSPTRQDLLTLAIVTCGFYTVKGGWVPSRPRPGWCGPSASRHRLSSPRPSWSAGRSGRRPGRRTRS